ncbi:MAG: class I SAM-dependent methyltransferase [Acidimicrobiales bacterium]
MPPAMPPMFEQPERHQATADYLELNRASWDERVPIHVASDMYDRDEFLAGADHLHAFESDELGDLSGRRLVHLQCHFAMDTLSLARRGATVTGLDFSPAAIAVARQLSELLGMKARFVEAGVYEAVEALGETYDVVYTGKGAINWLPDLRTWAKVIASLLEPGGFLYLSEYHPLVGMMGDDSYEPQYPYFNSGAIFDDAQGTYADPEAIIEHTSTVEWSHPLSEVLTAVIEAGLSVELFNEHQDCTFPRFSFMERHGPRDYRLPAGAIGLPFMYSLRAVKKP